MPEDQITPIDRLAQLAPFGRLPAEVLSLLSGELLEKSADADEVIFTEGDDLPGLYVILAGNVEIRSAEEAVVSHRGAGDLIGDRGLLREGIAVLTVRATEPTTMLGITAARFHELMQTVPDFALWFDKARPSQTSPDSDPGGSGLMAVHVADMMSPDPITCAPETTVQDVARMMRDRSISSVLVMKDDSLAGIVTVHDLVNKVLAAGLFGDLEVASVMTDSPVTIRPDALGLDALMMMAERKINHLPVADRRGALVGMIGRTDLMRRQATTASHMASELVAASSAAEMTGVMARLPDLLTHLTNAGTRPGAICRRITDLTDAATRRLLALAEAEIGAPPVPYLWAACGSQGRREQTGVSDQDNCLILDDAATPEHDAYFAQLAQFVSDGLNEIGFVYCPGDMMATNPRWRQPMRVWRGYFANWIDQPDEMAQMLASVMFDLRPISGAATLLDDLQQDTLARAQRNTIFVRQMIGNSLKHAPPLGLFGGISTIRHGDHKNTVDLKHAGVVPIVDLARVYALRGAIAEVGTHERIVAAGAAGVVSATGARDLLDAFDLIAETRLRHQARQIANGTLPDNFLALAELSDLERNHLRDAFLVVRTMQSALSI
ncbi:CBS domain-containing protein [Aliishimia ponticola]|uniref:CBS domain-containing protein n=1 Tax=Aliishimia ponticola TaxID=2499833 RepID=A0A4S4NBQ7_9RHOB|nr:DUF294 nucleotidyltransferase-like domain-containing protein [Aliishimia ponticola]THH36105.1 CBS domain-containing protein [Aliishimia ponticola]